ncbi:hypothetical protein E4U17_004458 [Claviceps sp. LM77 group G4]|nr:hypothetical protein E4U17_004458 [Claviceps sp. LM77 group G4]KAG6080202.1 hypothetical protein E4U33_007828 [Claviceps sp. LM78 group G4]KAG6081928.1 hypothetical protein E4U16_006760 [Claviceps sp. LM84 group G4]
MPSQDATPPPLGSPESVLMMSPQSRPISSDIVEYRSSETQKLNRRGVSPKKHMVSHREKPADSFDPSCGSME